jgi:hypothetical protein
MEIKNHIYKNTYAVFYDIAFVDGITHGDVLVDYFMTKKAAESQIAHLKTITPVTSIIGYFNFKIIKYTRVK